jgi:HSP20 family protein
MLPIISRRSYSPFSWSDFFEDGLLPSVSNRTTTLPAVNIKEDEKSFVLDLAVPGIDKKDLKIEIQEDMLTVSSESKTENEESQDGFKRKEFSYSSFCRSFYIPENVNREKIQASYKDGILSVELPKQDEEKTKLSKQIKIS